MKIINKNSEKIEFIAEVNESLANAIRRYLNHISIIAVDEVEISKNDSALYDETVAHRIGLIPFKMEKVGDENKTFEIKLNVKKEGVVYSEELNGDIKPVYDKIPITSLKKGQEITLVATAKSGKGIVHPKFSPGLMFYRNIIEVQTDKECPIEVVESCPKNIFELKENKLSIKDNTKCDMCEACVDVCKKKGKGKTIALTPSKELMITVESWGQISINDLVKKSIEELKKDLKEISKQNSK